MSGLAPLWLTVVQCVLAGIVIGLCVLHWAWWRGPLRRAGMAWSIAWSFALALLCLSNGLLTAVTPGAGVEPLHFLRFCLLATAVVLSLPAVHAWTQGPPVAAVALLTGAWYAAVAVLWLSTDLVFAHSFVEGLPVYGPAAPSVHLLPLIGVGAYVLRAVRRRALDRARLVMATAGAASSALLVGSFVPPPTALSEVLRGVWVVPLVVGLHVMVAARIRTSQRVGVRHAAMRDALAEVANAALFLK
ncbi:MAG: diguanylate cyclase/phosphodiesterase, partial [Actinotalea sp.]|nr:diguanylate cyclase/phosphodiesterase [Actinotalea sp.]